MSRLHPAALAEPVVQAPMAGGVSTPALAAAVSDAGGLGFVAGGYADPEAVRRDVRAVRAATPAPFGVNLLAPDPEPPDAAGVSAYARRLAGLPLGEPAGGDDHWDDKLAVVLEERPAVVSFAFGCPPAAVSDALRGAGCAVWITVAAPAEAPRAVAAGADALVVQGVEAGGHRGGLSDDPPGDFGLLALLQLVAAEAPGVPLVATGGIMTGAGVAGALAAGAAAAQLGTAFARCPEAGTAGAHRRAIASPAPTALTRAFTGRSARGVVNAFLREHSAAAPRAYPHVHQLTAPARAEARRAGDAARMSLWAGQAHALAAEVPAAELVRRLGEDARRRLRDAAGR